MEAHGLLLIPFVLVFKTSNRSGCLSLAYSRSEILQYKPFTATRPVFTIRDRHFTLSTDTLIAKELLPRLGIPETDQLVEVGCGPGFVTGLIVSMFTDALVLGMARDTDVLHQSEQRRWCKPPQ
jgi:hypothetical protein